MGGEIKKQKVRIRNEKSRFNEISGQKSAYIF
jgi:hypothetical protein